MVVCTPFHDQIITADSVNIYVRSVVNTKMYATHLISLFSSAHLKVTVILMANGFLKKHVFFNLLLLSASSTELGTVGEKNPECYLPKETETMPLLQMIKGQL